MTVYDPKGYGKDKAVSKVEFVETLPPEHLRSVVHRFIELKTDGELAEDYKFHALPDACTYLVFDQKNLDVAGITQLRANSEELNLGRSFHYINVRFYPGVCKFNDAHCARGQVDQAYNGPLPLVTVNNQLRTLDDNDKQAVLVGLVEDLIAQGLVVAETFVKRILEQIDDIRTVSDMAETTNMSSRQLQRALKQTTGFAPHDFLKVLRLQQALRGEDTGIYADQSHFIHSFRKATGYTPGRYAQKYDV